MLGDEHNLLTPSAQWEDAGLVPKVNQGLKDAAQVKGFRGLSNGDLILSKHFVNELSTRRIDYNMNDYNINLIQPVTTTVAMHEIGDGIILLATIYSWKQVLSSLFIREGRKVYFKKKKKRGRESADTLTASWARSPTPQRRRLHQIHRQYVMTQSTSSGVGLTGDDIFPSLGAGGIGEARIGSRV